MSILRSAGNLSLLEQIERNKNSKERVSGAISVLTAGVLVNDIVTREIPTGLLDGINKTFVLANVPKAGTEEVNLNGVLMKPGAGNDYILTTNTIVFEFAPEANGNLSVSYIK